MPRTPTPPPAGDAAAGVLAVVAVEHDDPSAPAGSAALRTLRSIPLVRRAVLALTRSRCVGRVVVAAAPGLAVEVEAVLDGLATLAGTAVEVLSVPRDGPGAQVLATLDALVAQRATVPAVVVVHDPLHPLAPPELVDAVVAGLATRPPGGGSWGAVVPVRPVTDTLTWVDEDERVRGPADREAFRMVYSPQAFDTAVLHDALRLAPPAALRGRGAELLPELVQARGVRLLSVPAPGEVFRVSSAADLVLAEATLHVGGDPAAS